MKTVIARGNFGWMTAILMLVGLGAVSVASAADYTWGPTAASNSWSVNSNWTPTAPLGGPDASTGVFVLVNSDIAQASTIYLYNTTEAGDAIKTVGRLDIGDLNNTHSFTLAAGSGAGVLDFNGNGSHAQLNQLSTSKGDTISASISVSSTLDINNASVNTLTLSGSNNIAANVVTMSGISGSTINLPNGNALVGAGSLVISTTGTVSFGAGTGGRPNNPFTGGTTLNSGALVLSGGNSGGGGTAGALGTGILTINGGTINGAGNISGHQLTMSGQVWNGDWSYLNSKNLDMGTGAISLGSGAGAVRTVTVNAGAGVALTISGPISNGSTGNSLTKAGAGPLILAGANTYTGPTTVSAGTLQLAKEVALYNNASGNWTASNIVVSNGATLYLNVGGTGEFTSGDLDILLALGTGSGGFLSGAIVGLDTTDAASGFTYAGVIANPNSGANALGLNKLGTNTLVLSGANTYSGGTIVSAGTLQLTGVGGVGSGPVSVVGGTLDLNNLTRTFGSTLLLGGASASTLAIGASGTLTLGGDVSYDATANTVAMITGGTLNQ